MSTNTQVESEDVFEKVRGKTTKAIETYLADTYAQDREDIASDIAEILDIETDEMPKFSVEIVLHLGKQAFITSGLAAEEKDEDDEDSAF